MRRWRNFLLRLFGARMDKTASVYGSATVWYPPNLEMSRFATIGPGVTCYNMDRITIGEYAVVSQRAHLCAGTHDFDRPGFQLYTRPIAIGDHAWVAAEAFVGPGVTVGEGAVVGARAVVTRSVAPWTVNAGNPARELRQRRAGGMVDVKD
jgi:putative colanic acid biosynthesis acetyltransferase WcaF